MNPGEGHIVTCNASDCYYHHGGHEECSYSEPFYRILVDGTPWTDGDGQSEWTPQDARSLAAHLESQGYDEVGLEPID